MSSKKKHAGGRPPFEGDMRRGVQVGVRLPHGIVERLDALAARTGGVLSRAGVAHAAVRLGLAALEADPSRMFEPED